MKVEFLARCFQILTLIAATLIPSVAIWYLASFSAEPPPLFENHLFHEIAILIATVEGGFVSYVSWRSYRASGEIFLRWLTAGLLVFTLIYAPHGLLTRTAHQNIWLFLLYGPVSRLAMVACMIYGLAQYGKASEDPAIVWKRGFWRNVVFACAVIVIGVAVLAYSPIAGSPWVRKPMEAGAAVLCLAAIISMLRRQVWSHLMAYYAVALLLFAQAALAFILAKPWNHMWWLAHAIFAGGFSVMSWGVVRALLTTRSFANAYSEAQLMRALETEKGRLNESVKALQRSDARLQSVFDASPDTLLISNEDGEIVMSNRQVTSLLGYEVDEVIGQSIDLLVPEDKRAKHVAQRASYRNAPSTRNMGQGLEVSARRKDGTEVPVEVSLGHLNVDGNMLIASAMRDITERKRMEKELRELAFCDALTKLPNRRGLLDRLGHALLVSQRHQKHGALLFLDMNRFKQLNDTYGHEAGDQLLIEVALRLKKITRNTDMVARLGGDEFVILLEELDSEASTARDQATQIAEKVSQILNDEYVLGDVRYRSSASIGFTLFFGEQANPDEIIRKADAAMYANKTLKHIKQP